MKGLELARKFYKEYGEPMLKGKFPEIFPRLCIGLAGSGSECFGFDDERSRDHDFGPAFCIFVPDDIDRETLFALERAYEKLPRDFLGFHRDREVTESGRRGVIKTGDFYESKTGSRDGVLSLYEWLSVPEYALAEAVNGEIFSDNAGDFGRIRDRLRSYPEDVRLKKLAGNLLLMGQAGQYNYNRCLSRGETAAAQMAVFEFVKSALSAAFLLEKTYMPYYKWSFRALRDLPVFSPFAEPLEYLLSSANEPADAAKKAEVIEKVCKKIAAEVERQGIVRTAFFDMEQLAFAVNDAVSDERLRNMHILCGIAF